jgi:ABC-2 type transport system permease protein
MEEGKGGDAMRNAYYIAKRELGAYFSSPIAYVVTAVYLAVVGGLSGFILYYTREATMRYVLAHPVTVLFLVLVTQVVTMRLLAEEQRSGTLEPLLTSPVRDWEVVVGKFAASLCLLLAMILLTAYIPIVLVRLGRPDIGPILAGYLGYALMGAALLSIGVFASSVTQSQIVAAVVGIGIVLLLWLSSGLTEVVGDTLKGIVEYLPIFGHYSDMLRGVIDTKDIIYYLSVTMLFLFLSTRVLESRRWK